jgi:DNA-directed RNA polymerase subunit E'/Rpb7
MLKNINQKVSIESKYLNSNTENHILDKLKKIMEGKCTLDNGYIIDVKRIINLGDNTIGGANSLVIFDVTYEVEILRPENGQILSGTVCMIFHHGIFVDIKGKMKVLIPSASMSSYIYNPSDNSFGPISKGINVSIEIVMIKYEKKQFSCIGKLKTIF